MARFSYEDADKYGSTGSGGSFFSLKNDRDTARVQLVGDSMKDFPGYSVHEVYDAEGKKRYVNCLREAGDPIGLCPFCANRIKLQAKLFIPLYNIDDDEMQVWERGKKFFGDLSSYCSHTPHVGEVVTEIERRGKANDTSTTYGLFEIRDEKAPKTLDELQNEAPEILGRYVLDKTADDMEYFLDHKCFPDADGDGDTNVRPRESRSESRRDSSPQRRTATSRRSEEEF